MAIIELGIKSDECSTHVDFKRYTSDLGGNYNPYNQAFFDNPEHMASIESRDQITSIPSPYARMHVTELAFREYNCGAGVVSDDELHSRVMSADYRKAVSHCLDIYELLYNSDKINLKDKGFTLHKIDLISTKSTVQEVKKLFVSGGKQTPLYYYIKTLDLFRESYRKVIEERKQTASGFIKYNFDFSSLYILKYKGKTIAATSPFTGFYAKADCDLRNSLGANNYESVITVNGHNLLTNNEKDWQGIAQRSNDFKEFMFLLLRDTGLQYIFKELFEAIKNSFEDKGASLENEKFDKRPEYGKFNVSENPLQLIVTNRGDVNLRQDGIDCSYLKYMLYLTPPVELTISEEEYAVDIAQRRFPKDGAVCQWIGVNDLLSDAIFVLNYEINDNYITIPYKDMVKDEQMKYRCLLPVKRLALEYFSIEELVNRIFITKRRDNVFVVEFRLPLKNGGETVLRKEYRVGDDAKYPNGVVIGGDCMNPFALGIYPFIKSNEYKNIYKILFYNSFEQDYQLKFYHKNGNNVIEYLQTERIVNKTNDIKNEELPVNCEYHHISAKEGLEFMEVCLNEKLTSIIVPKLRTPKSVPGRTDVAIDLGTSNTYIAYSFRPDGASTKSLNIRELNTHHGVPGAEWNELTFMNKKCEVSDDPNAPEKNREDLYLRTSDLNKTPSAEWLPTQLLEFIPSRIDPTLKDSYRFPIPTVMNFLRRDKERRPINRNDKIIPLLHTAIPFAYYENGIRQGEQPEYYDAINDGSRFKWFGKMVKGDYKEDPLLKECFKSFMAELLFIVRCHLLSNGYPLSECHIIWSYPLSFADVLISDYKSEWESAYKKYIYNDHEDITEYVKYTNESRTPIYECMTDPTSANHLTLLLDIGGGSTDVIGYKNQKPVFISSFSFAGNSLYLGGELNSPDNNPEDNSYLIKYIKEDSLFSNTNRDSSFRNVKIGLDRPIGEIMNYGFAKSPDSFSKIFMNNQSPKYMLLFHNAAIIYHVAQLCKAKSPNEVPVSIFLTGNGSKLFALNSDKNNMIRSIFKYVYEMDEEKGSLSMLAAEKVDNIDLPSQKNPKAATAWGALKGIYSQTLATNDESHACQVIPLGDKGTVFDADPHINGANIGENYDIKSAVKPNVEAFIDMFYSIIYKIPKPDISKDMLISALDFIKDNDRICVPANGVISQSLFFQYISLIMERLSIKIARS